MAAAKVMALAPGSHLHPCADNHQQLLVVLRGAVHITTSESQSINHATTLQQPDGTHVVRLEGKEPRLYGQTDAASLQTSGSTQSHGAAHAESRHLQSVAGQGPAGRAGQSHAGPPQAGQLPSDSASSSQMQDKDILDARGCAFALPGLLLGSALDVHVTAKTVVEAYSIPWSLIQAGFLLLCCTSWTQTCWEVCSGA